METQQQPESRLGSLVASMRLREQPSVLVLYLFGLLDSNLRLLLDLRGHVTLMVSFLLASIAFFVLNELRDKAADQYRLDRAAAEVRLADARAAIALLTLMALLLAGWVGASALLLVALFSALAIAYSGKPLRLKARYPWDQLSLLAMLVMPYLGPRAVAASGSFDLNLQPGSWLPLAYLALFLGACNTLPLARDARPDRESKLRTTGAVLGAKCVLLTGVLALALTWCLQLAMVYQRMYLWYLGLAPFVFALSAILAYQAGQAALARKIEEAKAVPLREEQERKLARGSRKGVWIGNLLWLAQLLGILYSELRQL